MKESREYTGSKTENRVNGERKHDRSKRKDETRTNLFLPFRGKGLNERTHGWNIRLLFCRGSRRGCSLDARASHRMLMGRIAAVVVVHVHIAKAKHHSAIVYAIPVAVVRDGRLGPCTEGRGHVAGASMSTCERLDGVKQP